MRKLILLMHVSLDGYVAGPNGEMDWIKVNDEMFDIAGALTDKADTALYGRTTFQMMEQYWPTVGSQPHASKHDIEHSRWYNSVEKIVASRSLSVGDTTSRTVVIAQNLPEEIIRLKHRPGKNILMIGSPGTVHSLLPHHLIDEYRLFLNPVLIGKGIPLFTDTGTREDLRLIETKQFTSGVIGLHYTSTNQN